VRYKPRTLTQVTLSPPPPLLPPPPSPTSTPASSPRPVPLRLFYRYPSKQLHRVLRKGTERGYTDANFSNDGKKLVTVGSNPDFMLTVWDWEAERIILRTKAFSQEVYRCTFHPESDGFLTTSGMGTCVRVRACGVGGGDWVSG
jgi:hypothetical protein